MTDLQKEVTSKVIAAWRTGGSPRHYRAAGSGERVTLASLYRAGVLARRCWRGHEGEPDAAYEYRPSEDLLKELAVMRAEAGAADQEVIVDRRVVHSGNIPPEGEASVLCERCAGGHGAKLVIPCRESGCECWCQRTATVVDEVTS